MDAAARAVDTEFDGALAACKVTGALIRATEIELMLGLVFVFGRKDAEELATAAAEV
ncbi:hypothetical protein N9Z88_00405 [Akkermansiaceae bacterium]|nr:hypothetical protein [Akkermansiaceae bacterium]